MWKSPIGVGIFFCTVLHFSTYMWLSVHPSISPQRYRISNFTRVHGSGCSVPEASWTIACMETPSMQAMAGNKITFGNGQHSTYPLVICYIANWKDPRCYQWVDPLFLW